MKYFYAFFTGLMITCCCHAQSFGLVWAKAPDYRVQRHAENTMTLDASGNIYIADQFRGTVDFDPGPAVFNLVSNSNSYNDTYITKLSPAGNFIWAKKVGGTNGVGPSSIIPDASGNLLITGGFSGTADFDPGSGVVNLTCQSTMLFGGSDTYILKLDADGNFIWVKQFAASGNSQSAAGAITTTASGNIFITGPFEGTVDFDPGAGVFNYTSGPGVDDGFIVALNATGNFIWAKKFGGAANSIIDFSSINADANSNLYITGGYVGTVNFNTSGGTFNLTGTDAMYVLKVDASGNFTWAISIPVNANEGDFISVLDAQGNPVITSFFTGTTDFDPGAGVTNLTSAGGQDIFIAKFSTAGNLLWAKRIGGTGDDAAVVTKVHTNGDIYFAGDYSGTVDFDPGVGVYNLAGNSDDAFVAELDASGNFKMASGFGRPISTELVWSIGVEASGNVVLWGKCDAGTAMDIDPCTGISNITPTTAGESFLIKFSQAGCNAVSPLTVTINQAAAQPDPTTVSPINFTVVFNEAVTGFATGDVSLSGTAGATTATVTGSGTTYNVAVVGMTASGTVIATIAAGVAVNAGGTGNLASTSTDNTVTFTVTVSPPTVTINQAVAQPDPTTVSPINFTVVFNQTVTGFATGDITLSGTAGATTATVTGSGATYNVAVTGMTTSGTVIATIAANVATNAGGAGNLASTSTDNTVTFTIVVPPPTVTINQAVAQPDPTTVSPINFTVVFNETVTGFVTGDVTLSGTAGATTATVTGSGTTYNVAVTGMTTSGTVIATIAAGVAMNAGGTGNLASTSTDNTVTFTVVVPAPTVTINQAAAQADPTSVSPIDFTVVFSQTVTGFTTGDVSLSGTAGATTATVTGSGATYNVAVTGMTASGTVIATIAAGVAMNAGGTGNLASTSTDNTVTFTIVVPPPTVTINQAAAQPDPTTVSPINFTVVFSETVTGFTTGDVSLSGTAGATTATVTGSGTTYNVAVTGMTTSGTVIATIAAGVAVNAGGTGNLASTSTDNTVTFTVVVPPPTVTINQAAAQPDPTTVSPINFTVVFSQTVTGFTTSDVTLSGTAGTTTATVTGSGTTYNVAVSGMTTSGTVIATIAAGVAMNAGGTGNLASISTDNTVTFTVALKFNIYPIPAKNGDIKISIPPEMAGAAVRIYNVLGQKIKEWTIPGGLNSYTLSLPAGTYVFKFIKKDVIRIERKVIIIR